MESSTNNEAASTSDLMNKEEQMAANYLREGILVANYDKSINFVKQSARALSSHALHDLGKLFKIPKQLQQIADVMHPILLRSPTYARWKSSSMKYMINKS